MLRAVSMMIGTLRFRPEQPADIGAVELGQQQIQDDQIRLFAPRRIQRFLSVVRGQNAVAVPLKVKRNQVYDLLVVVHDEDGAVHITYPKSVYHSYRNASMGFICAARLAG